MTASPSGKGSIAILYRFKGRPNAAFPAGALTYVDGRFFGATNGGGRSFCSLDTGCGTVYTISPSGKRERVLYQFSHNKNGEYKDGELPNGGLIDRNGTFYGTTAGGGRGLAGTMFSLSCHAGKCSETVLQSFNGSGIGSDPNGDLVDEGGTLYGTAALGGSEGYGTVFAASSSGQVNAIYSFKGGSDGERPEAGLTDVDGMLYGTTEGQPYGSGTVFKITTSGVETVLHQFGGTDGSGVPDGVQPFAKMIYVGGRLYGTTYWGGEHELGTVFSITPSGDERVVYSFAGGLDGKNPGAALISVNGEIYGTTATGGANGDGTIFKIDGSGHESVLYSFKGGTDGTAPDALFELNGSLYGTTHAGGNFSDCLDFEVACGTLFRMPL
ncbi:MAG TPA: choice-of-anchor tandem repeat GloVer-containing protein [Candidatus Cybelea sp.]|jgi:uncharacterized repeat protein (TIGR03803 family)